MSVTFAKGFRAAGVEAGISAVDGKKDLALVVNDGPLDAMAGVFTPNRFCAAPVQWTRGVVADGHAKAVILNSGGANACTGQAGYDQSAATRRHGGRTARLHAPRMWPYARRSDRRAAARWTTSWPAPRPPMRRWRIPPRPGRTPRTPS